MRRLFAAAAGLNVSAFAQAPGGHQASRTLEARLAQLLEDRERDLAVEAATIAALLSIDDASERAFNLRESASRRVSIDDRVGREASGWFS